jgi:hypothetical protein
MAPHRLNPCPTSSITSKKRNLGSAIMKPMRLNKGNPAKVNVITQICDSTNHQAGFV